MEFAFWVTCVIISCLDTYVGILGSFEYVAVLTLILRGCFGHFSVDHLVLLVLSTIFILMIAAPWSFVVWGVYVYMLRFHSPYYFRQQPLTFVQYF